MPLLTDQAAKETALRRWVLPECLHVPVAAVDIPLPSGTIPGKVMITATLCSDRR